MAETQTVSAVAADIPLHEGGLETPTIFVDDVRGTMVGNGVAKLNMVQYRVDPVSNELRAVPTAFLVIPAEMLENFGNFFLKIAAGDGGSAQT